MLGALGVVFGDIGTSPLYALKECFHSAHAVSSTHEHVLGVLSLIFWSLILIVSVKYLVYVMRADRDGEGGILALLSLAVEKCPSASKKHHLLMLAGVFGAAFLYGDGMITPAITTLGAIEGLSLKFAAFQQTTLPDGSVANNSLVVGLSSLILVGLFSFQKMGTEKVGKLFGPVCLLWFAVLTVLGFYGIRQAPEVLTAFNPWHGMHFLMHSGWHGFLVMGAVFLVVTGGEALYADMGHFGIKPIRYGWFAVVLPSLMINYLGQGAYLLHNPDAAAKADFNPFYQMAPSWALVPLVILASAAAVIASQALITGVYSLTLQAIQMGYLPRVAIRHTSAHMRGQIYVPLVNWVLMIACVGLVIGFNNSTNLAAAYGIAVTLTMLITTVLFYFVARDRWGWSLLRTLPICLIFLVAEIVFFAANIIKIADGGWFPLVVGVGLFTIQTTWRKGRELVRKDQETGAMEQELFLQSIKMSDSVVQVPGTAVYMCGSKGKTPASLLHNLKHNKVLHERVIFCTIVTDDTPYVLPSQQVELEEIEPRFYRLTGHYGFLQEPDVPQLFRRARNQYDFDCRPETTTFFLGKETIVPSKLPGMAPWREHLFAFLCRVAQAPSHFFKLPEGRVVELGVRVRI
jgi:KUP system potassium uptake protein